MKRVDAFFIILMIVAIIAIGILAYIAVSLGPYKQVADYINKNNITGVSCDLCQQLYSTGIITKKR